MVGERKGRARPNGRARPTDEGPAQRLANAARSTPQFVAPGLAAATRREQATDAQQREAARGGDARRAELADGEVDIAGEAHRGDIRPAGAEEAPAGRAAAAVNAVGEGLGAAAAAPRGRDVEHAEG